MRSNCCGEHEKYILPLYRIDTFNWIKLEQTSLTSRKKKRNVVRRTIDNPKMKKEKHNCNNVSFDLLNIAHDRNLNLNQTFKTLKIFYKS